MVAGMEIGEQYIYRHRWTGALVRIREVADDGTVLWHALDAHRINGHVLGQMFTTEFARDFEQIGEAVKLRMVG